ncbi:MAG: hypothetical protein ACE5JH_12370 [Acidobacteriota bacterium]
MKRLMLVVVCLCPALAYGQRTYTNADLARFEVPGAYTNEDLRRLPPLAVQREPAAKLPRFSPSPADRVGYQRAYEELMLRRAALLEELDYELEAIDFSESAFAGGTRDLKPRLGYRAKVRHLVLELEKRIALLERSIDRLRDDARRAGAPIDTR